MQPSVCDIFQIYHQSQRVYWHRGKAGCEGSQLTSLLVCCCAIELLFLPLGSRASVLIACLPTVKTANESEG